MTAPDTNALLAKLNRYAGTASTDLTDLELAYLCEQLTSKKKYGLIWEDKPEAVEQQLLTGLPILTEVPERHVENVQRPAPSVQKRETPHGTLDLDFSEPGTTGVSATGEAPFPPSSLSSPSSLNSHTLIEGDNLHALTVLNYTHAGQVDVIYIDPPYNTGNKDFKYNDSFVDREDSYRHSKWLSFMAKRLRLAKTLLKDTGVIFISIDDNEQAQLKLLCDEVFGEENFVGNVIWQHSIQGKNDAKTISLHHNYTFIYGQQAFQIGKIPRTEEHNVAYSNPDNDPNGPWRSGDVRSPNLRANLRYNIETPSGKIISPPEKGWRWEKKTLLEKIETGEVTFIANETKILRKIYLSKQEGRVPESIWFGKEVGTTRDGTQTLKELYGDETPFDTPKPVELIKRILQIGGPPNALVLDFFAGSGTTLHAVMALNDEDNRNGKPGKRRCILVTNNENNIAEDVCYERNRRVIQGYTNSKGVNVPGLPGNALRYYRTALVGREKTLTNKRALMRQATDLLCLKEGCYEEEKREEGGKGERSLRLFTGPDARAMLLVYDPDAIDEAVALIQQLAQTDNPPTTLSVYVFANGTYPYTDEFEDVLPGAPDRAEFPIRVSLCALPDAIYRAYKAILPNAADRSPAQPDPKTTPVDTPDVPKATAQPETNQTALF